MSGPFQSTYAPPSSQPLASAPISMAPPPISTTLPLSTTTALLPVTSAALTASLGSSPNPHLLTHKEMSHLIVNLTYGLRDQGAAINGIREELERLRKFLMGDPPRPPRPSLPMTSTTVLPTPFPDSFTVAIDGAPASTGVPLHRMAFPPSPSSIPLWFLGSTQGGVFSSPPPRTAATPLSSESTVVLDAHGTSELMGLCSHLLRTPRLLQVGIPDVRRPR